MHYQQYRVSLEKIASIHYGKDSCHYQQCELSLGKIASQGVVDIDCADLAACIAIERMSHRYCVVSVE